MRALDLLDPSSASTAVLDALPVIAWMADPLGKTTFLSRRWTELSGIDGREIVEHGAARIVHPDDRAALERAWEASRAHGTRLIREIRLRFADGSYRWFLNEGDAIRGDDGSIAGWFGTLTDVDDLHAAEQRLASAREAAAANGRAALARAEFAKRLMDANEDCVSVLSIDGNLLSSNAVARSIFEPLLPPDGERRPWPDVWSGASRISAGVALEAAKRGGRGRFTGVRKTAHGDGWWDVIVTPVPGADGERETLLAVERDVTERFLTHRALKQSDARFRTMSKAMPGMVWSATPEGHFEILTEGPMSDLRRPSPERDGDGWLDIVHEDDRAGARASWQHSLATGETYDAIFRVAMLDDTYRWQIVRALPQYDEGGAIVSWYGFALDIDDRRRADEARAQLARLVDASDDLIGVADLNGRMTYANAALRRTLGVPAETDLRSLHRLDFFTPADRALAEIEIPAALERDGRWVGDFRLRDFRTGAPIPVSYNTFTLHDDEGRATGCGAVARDLRERLRLEIGMQALADAGAAMYDSLDVATTTANVTAAVAKTFASWCSIETLEADGRIATLAGSHRSLAMQAQLEATIAARRYTDDDPVVRAIRTGAATIRDGAAAETGTRSVISVPIRSTQDGRIFGSMTCGIDGEDPRGVFTAEDVRFAEEIAVRAGLAFEHARAYERERRIAVTLQEASLPGILPTVDHLYLSAEYRPGKSEATIGGDWYDAFPLDDGRVVITIGDVLGNGLGAAVTMGKVRQAMQSVALVLPDPNTMLAAADRTVRAQGDDTYATAIAGIFDASTHTFSFASAGHPGPVLRRPDGSIESFDAPGILLGLRPKGTAETWTIETPPGSELVFFTDGLVEVTRDMDEGLRRLHAAIADRAVAGAESPARALVEHVLAGGPGTDDIAVLVAEVGPSARFDERLRTAQRRALELGLAEAGVDGTHGIATQSLGGSVMTIPARLAEIATARRAVRKLLATTTLGPATIDSAELAAGELVANAMEHGTGESVTIAIKDRDGATVIAVTNDGPAFAAEARDLEAMLESERGRGLAMLGKLGWELAIDTEEPGRCTVHGESEKRRHGWRQEFLAKSVITGINR